MIGPYGLAVMLTSTVVALNLNSYIPFKFFQLL